eukprot:COSAG06_NODE_2116_length_7557_cov_122.672298_5_plen_303_part_00
MGTDDRPRLRPAAALTANWLRLALRSVVGCGCLPLQMLRRSSRALDAVSGLLSDSGSRSSGLLMSGALWVGRRCAGLFGRRLLAATRCVAACPARMCVDRSPFAFHVRSFRRRLEVVGREILRRGGTFVAPGRLRTNRRAAPFALGRPGSCSLLHTVWRLLDRVSPRQTRLLEALTESFQGGQAPRARSEQSVPARARGRAKKSQGSRSTGPPAGAPAAIFVVSAAVELPLAGLHSYCLLLSSQQFATLDCPDLVFSTRGVSIRIPGYTVMRQLARQRGGPRPRQQLQRGLRLLYDCAGIAH